MLGHHSFKEDLLIDPCCQFSLGTTFRCFFVLFLPYTKGSVSIIIICVAWILSSVCCECCSAKTIMYVMCTCITVLVHLLMIFVIKYLHFMATIALGKLNYFQLIRKDYCQIILYLSPKDHFFIKATAR